MARTACCALCIKTTGFTSMTEFGIAMDGRSPIAAVPDLARAAEKGGAGTLWIASHLFLHDPIATAAIALGATRRIRVALMAMSPYTMHPVHIAMAAATLDEHAERGARERAFRKL